MAKSPRRRSSPSGAAAGTTTLHTLTGACLIAAMAIGAYATSFRGVFVYDDGVAIVGNPNIRSLWPLSAALSAPPESPVSARPVASLSLAINYALAPADVREVMRPAGVAEPPVVSARFLRNVWGYHAMNLALHVLAALAISGVVRRTLLTDRLRDRFGGAALWLGTAAGAIWAVHPLTTDAVTYVAQRTEVLMGLFYALTLYCAIRAGETMADARAVRRWTIAAIVACALGMGSKQTMVTAPVVVWMWDWIFLAAPQKTRRAVYGGLAATWILLGALVAYERWPTSIGFALEGWTPWTYLLTQTTVIAHYVRLAILGGPLSLDYDGWPMARSAISVLPYALPLLATFGLTVWGVVRRRAWAFPAAVWFAALAPSSSILPLATEIAAGRRMYVPLAAMAALAVVGGYAVVRRTSPAGRVIAVVAFVGIAAVYGSMTSARNALFASEERLWKDTVEQRPSNSRARVNYAMSLIAAGELRSAEEHLREAVRLKDTNAQAHLNLGAVLCRIEKFNECVQHLERALSLDPRDPGPLANLGEAYGALGQRAAAASYFSRAVDARPADVFLLNRLGWLLATAPEAGVRNGAKSLTLAERAVELTARNDATSLDTLAAALAETGRLAEAVAVGREALALAERQGPLDLLPELSARVALFQAGRPYREPVR